MKQYRWLLLAAVFSLGLAFTAVSPAKAGFGIGFVIGPFWGPPVYVVPPPVYVAPPVIYATPRYGGRCDYWASRCNRNWSRRKDFLGCLRYHRC
ncbi:MAG: hypothetical protein ACR2O0_08365 [Rhizobiaceae bacterium]